MANMALTTSGPKFLIAVRERFIAFRQRVLAFGTVTSDLQPVTLTPGRVGMMRYRTSPTSPWVEVGYSMYWMSATIKSGYEYQIAGRDY